jgi:hypothetical protein
MALVRLSRTITMDGIQEVNEKLFITSIQLIGTGMTIGQRLTLTEAVDGTTVIADHYVEAANENVELLNNEQWFDGIRANVVPAAGTWTILIRYK